MKCSTHLVLTGLMTVAISAAAFGAGILDQQLGNDGSAPAATPAPAPAVKPAEGPAVAPKLIDPEAARVVDDMDLLKKLTSGAADSKNETGAAQQLKDMMDRMGQSQKRLSDKDPGPVTQETQRRIVVDLDALIEIARKQSNSQGQSKDQKSGQPQQRQASQASHSEGGSSAARNEALRSGGAQDAQSNGQDIHQHATDTWGNLPDRDRDLLAHGSNEQYLPAYRQLIDRYYQALAEMGRSAREH